jgi:TolB-like protein
MEKNNRILRFVKIFILLFITAFANIKSQEPAKNNLAILPFQSIGINDHNMLVIHSILRVEISKQGSFNIIADKTTAEAISGEFCADKECAIEVGKELKASTVLGGKLAALGEKIIVQYFLVDVDLEKEILIDQLTATDIEELELIMKRIAISVTDLKSFEESAEVGVITQAETEESLRRTSNKNFGLSFGYLYPQNGYDDYEKSFVLDVRFDYEMEEMAIGMLLGVHRGFTANIYGSYLFSKSDICPYIGGGVGFHWVLHDSYFRYNLGMENNIYNSEKLHGDGFEIALNGGVRLFHTYNFQIIINLEYSFTFNDYDDRALILTIGLL